MAVVSFGGALAFRPHRLLRLELDGAYSVSETSTLASGPGGTFSVLGLGGRACIPIQANGKGESDARSHPRVGFAALEIAPCVGAHVEEISGTGVKVDVSRPAQAWSWGPEAGLFARLPLSRALAVRFRGRRERPPLSPALRDRSRGRRGSGVAGRAPHRARTRGAQMSTHARLAGQWIGVPEDLLARCQTQPSPPRAPPLAAARLGPDVAASPLHVRRTPCTTRTSMARSGEARAASESRRRASKTSRRTCSSSCTGASATTTGAPRSRAGDLRHRSARRRVTTVVASGARPRVAPPTTRPPLRLRVGAGRREGAPHAAAGGARSRSASSTRYSTSSMTTSGRYWCSPSSRR